MTKIWRAFLLFTVLVMGIISAVFPSHPVLANVSAITVNPYSSNFISTTTGYQIMMTSGAVLDNLQSITIRFPSDTTMPTGEGLNKTNYTINGIPCTNNATVSSYDLTVYIPGGISPGVPFNITINPNAGMRNPSNSSNSTSGPYKVEVWTSVEATHVLSAAYTITAVDVWQSDEITWKASYGTILAAITGAAANDIITVPAGTYNEDFKIDKPLTLRGAEYNVNATGVSWTGSTIINTSNSTGTGKPDYAGYSPHIKSDNVTFQGFKVTSNTTQPGFYIGGELAVCNNIRIENCEMTGMSEAGIIVSALDMNANLTNVVINQVYSHDNLSGNGIKTVNVNNPTISNCKITNNGATGSAEQNKYGVWIGATISAKPIPATITGNTFTGNNFGSIILKQHSGSGQTVDGTVINKNNFNDASPKYGINNTFATTNVTGKLNWWNNTSGPSHDAVNYGCKASSYVIYQPWLIEAYTTQSPATDLTITTGTALPAGGVAIPYSTNLVAIGGSGTHTWQLYSTGTIPEGLSLATTGVLSGTPTVPASSSFAAQVRDGVQGAYKDFTLQTYSTALSITTTSLAVGGINTPYSQALQASGGTGSYTYNLKVGSGPLPAGLTLAANGAISGTPTAAGTFPFTAEVHSNGQVAWKDLDITITDVQKILGMDDATPIGSASGEYVCMDKYVSAATGSVSQIRVNCSGAGNVKVALYADNSGSPGALFSANNTSTAVVAGWNTIGIPATTITQGTTYWIAFNSSAAVVRYAPFTGGVSLYKAVSYSSNFTNPAGNGYGAGADYHCLLAAWGVADTAQKIMGMDDAAPIGAASADYICMDKYISQVTGSVSQIRVNCSGAGNVKVALYSDSSSGSPGTLLNANNTSTAVIAGWNNISIPATTITQGTTYWIAFNSSAAVVRYATSTGGVSLYKAVSYSSDFPPAGSDFIAGYNIHCLLAGWGAVDAAHKFMGIDYYATLIGSASGSYVCMDKYQSTVTGNVTQIRVNCSGAGNVKVALYADSSGSPGALLNANNTGASVVAGWNTLTIPATPVTSGTTYWMAFNSSAAIVRYAPSTGGVSIYKAVSYTSDFANPAGTGYGTGSNYHCLLTGWGVLDPSKLLGMDYTAPVGSASGNYVCMDKYVSAATGSVTKIRVYCTGTGNVKVALYTDSAGSPNALLNANNTGAAVVAGWNNISIPATSVNLGTTYWVAFNSSTGCVAYATSTGGVSLFKAVSYSSDFANPAGTGYGVGSNYHCLTAGWYYP